MEMVLIKPRIVTVVGNVGAGKSSAIGVIADVLHGKTILADDLFQTTDPFRECFLNDEPRWALANELWLTKERMKILKQAMMTNTGKWLVVDSGLLMSWVYTHSHYLVGKITKEEWELYSDIFDSMAQQAFINSAVIYLDYSIETLLYRIKLRGRDYELKFYTEAYLRQLQAGLKALIYQLEKKQVKVIKITEAIVSDFVNNNKDRIKLTKLISQGGF